MASILLRHCLQSGFRIEGGQNSVTRKKDRLKEIQDQLDLLMDELHRLRTSISDEESRRRTYPFPFERAEARESNSEKPGGRKKN